jgi:hypothetical protein
VFTKISAVSLCLLLAGCAGLKKAAIVSSVGTTGALVGNAIGGPAGLVTGGLTTGFITDIATEVAIPTKGGSVVENCAPDNFWSLLGTLIEMGGWALILIVIVPMLFSWLLPGPIRFKKKTD